MTAARKTFALLACALGALAAPPAAVAQSGGDGEQDDLGDVLCGLPLLPKCPTPAPQPPPQPPTPQPPAADPRAVAVGSPNPLVGLRWYVDKKWTPQYKQYERYLRHGEHGKAALIGKFALQPQFKWFGRWNDDDKGGTARSVRSYLERVQEEQPGSVPQIVTLRHQGKACHKGYAAGGPAEDDRTKRWFENFARGVGGYRVVIGFEPDSLGTIDCLAKHRRQARLDVLRHGIDVLSQLPNATIYVEAGASDWEPASRTAKLLRQIGIHKVRGFMLNVTHYDWTGNNIRYGKAISRRVGGKPFIISTSFNGRGPVYYKKWINRRKHRWRRVTVWCHPLRRGLGIAPTTTTHDPHADGYFYIGRPGYSGGSCNGGPLPIGSWYEDRALMFARNQTDWVGPPRGTKFGWPRGTATVRQLAGDQFK